MNMKEATKKMKQDSPKLAGLSEAQRNLALEKVKEALLLNKEEIFLENKKDMESAEEMGIAPAVKKRLKFDEHKLMDVVNGISELIKLPDPLGKVQLARQLDEGLNLYRVSCPIGVIGIIFEARPDALVQISSLCLKSGNAVILRGGKEAINSNTALADIMREALAKAGFPQDVIQLVGDTSRQSANDMMHMNEYLDCLIPRGGKGLIKAVVENSTVPVIETGSGNCHIYVDESADINMAANIIFNAKTQRISVCNACESLVINSKIIDKALPVIAKKLKEKDVEIRGDERAQKACSLVVPATDEDFATEYLDYIISVKTVDTVDEAIAHINANSTGHSEAIITENKENAEKFLKCIDSSSVYVNASTRFTDGAEFGLGAEIGISTQKLHARGPMGLEQLTSTKYLIYGDGQVR